MWHVKYKDKRTRDIERNDDYCIRSTYLDTFLAWRDAKEGNPTLERRVPTNLRIESRSLATAQTPLREKIEPKTEAILRALGCICHRFTREKSPSLVAWEEMAAYVPSYVTQHTRISTATYEEV